MSTNIDRSLDDIIKDQKRLKKKALKKKTQQTQKKGTQKQQKKNQGNKGTSIKQNQRRRIAGKNAGQSAQQRQGAQGRKRPATGKQKGQVVQQRGGSGNQTYKKNQTVGNKGRTRGAKVAVNRLKNKQSNAQKSKQIISKAKQIQQNRRLKNRQTQQKDARQNIINNRRGMQINRQNKAQNVKSLVATRQQRKNRRGMQAPQLTVSINNPRVTLTRTPQWKQPVSQQTNPRSRRGWRGKSAANIPRGMGLTEDLRISVPNNLHQLSPLKPLVYTNHFNPPMNTAMTGKTFATLDERFSSMSQHKPVRTIVVE